MSDIEEKEECDLECDDEEEDKEMMLSISTIEKVLKVQKALSYQLGRELSFIETIQYVSEDFIDRKILKIKY